MEKAKFNKVKIKTAYTEPTDIIEFGCHIGKKIVDVIDSDTSYLIWCLKNLKVDRKKFRMSKALLKLLDDTLNDKHGRSLNSYIPGLLD